MTAGLESLQARLDAVRQAVDTARLSAGRTDPVTIVAVTKMVPVERVRAAYAAGQRVFGENRVQEAAVKIEELAQELSEARWHLIGHLQSNKVRPAVRAFSVIESVDSIKLARLLDAAASSLGPRLPVLLEVNVAEEPTKHGFRVPELADAVPELLKLSHLRLRGLMTVAPPASEPESVRWVFRRLRELRDEVREKHELAGFTELSMGMSGDYRVAIEEGATMVRIGRAIFGERRTERG